MIQRIQSILLLAAAVFVFALFQLPFGSSDTAIAASPFFNDRVFDIQDHIGLIGLFCAAGALSFIAIFLFNNRSLQITLSRFSIIANVLGIILGIVLFMQDSANMGAQTPNEELGLGLPILSIIFTLLAIRFINKDQELVDSSNRLR
jgi:hypothetical protein